jgi:hypothetical protein
VYGDVYYVFTSLNQAAVSLRGGISQSEANYFSSYAKAVLHPLPKGTLLLINNDQVSTQ